MVDLPPGFRVVQPAQPTAPQGSAQLPAGFRVVQPSAPPADAMAQFSDLPYPGNPNFDPKANAPKQDLLSAVGDASTAFQAGANQGMTLGFGDEMYAGVSAPLRALGPMMQGEGYDLGAAYQEGLDQTRQGIAADQAKNPVAAIAGDLTGGIVTGGTLAKGGVTLMNGAKATVPSIAGRAAAEGAIYGGVSGAGRSEGGLEDRAWAAADGALTGAAVGGALGAVGGSIAAKGARKAVPTVDDLEQQAGALYDAAEATGVTFPRAEVRQVADEIAAKALSEGIDPTLHPRATAALKRMQEAGEAGMTVKNVQTMRRILAAAGKDPMNPDEARIASMMIDRFDDMVAAKTPELATARGVYHQAKKGEMIEQAIELAGSRAGQFSGSGYENALRTEFRALERAIIKGQIKGMTKAEIAAIRHVARGGKVENVMRWIGKMAPTGVVSLGMGGGVPFAIGNAIDGPGLGAAAAGTTMLAGMLGRSAAANMTAANAARASAVARNGGAPVSVPPDQLAALQVLIAGGGNEGGQYALPISALRPLAPIQ